MSTNVHSQEHSASSFHPCTKKHICLIGAGMAGIKLAHYLLEKDDSSLRVTILEANDYIGGRICSTQFEGHTVERGANWISGLEEMYENPIWILAKQVNLEGHESNRDEQQSVLALHGENGTDMTEEYMETLQRFDGIYEKAVMTCAQQGIQPEHDVDVMTLLEQCGWKKPLEQTMLEQTVQTNVLDVWVANDLRNLSAAHDMRPGMNDVDLGKEEVFVEDPRGFNTIMNGMVHDIRKWGGTIKLNTVVERVEYAPENVQIKAKDIESEQVVGYSADIIVCTTSLGVLQNEHIEFVPPLPDWKKRAIHEIGMFCFAKVFARFDERFQPNKDQFAICTNKKGHYPFWMKYKNASDNLFMCHLAGLEAERVESLTDKEIKKEIEELFRNAFSIKLASVDPTIFRPTAVAVTNWSKNPRFCGSYSYFPVHAFATVREADLTCGLTGTNNRDGPKTFYFAGEALDDKFNGWVQGAYRSGERVAKSIIEDITL
jgi:polyamine oxidase